MHTHSFGTPALFFDLKLTFSGVTALPKSTLFEQRMIACMQTLGSTPLSRGLDARQKLKEKEKEKTTHEKREKTKHIFGPQHALGGWFPCTCTFFRSAHYLKVPPCDTSFVTDFSRRYSKRAFCIEFDDRSRVLPYVVSGPTCWTRRQPSPNRGTCRPLAFNVLTFCGFAKRKLYHRN